MTRFGKDLRKLCCLGGAVAILLLATSPTSTSARDPDADGASAPVEQRIKAQLIERFTRFIKWPEGRLPRPSSPFVLCLAGRDPRMEPHLRRLATTREIRGHAIAIREPIAGRRLRGCHAVWIPRGISANLDAVLARTRGRPILTLGDTDGFADKGVLINMRRTEEGRIAFDINLAAARKSGLRFSTKLLRLGRIVGSEESPSP